MKIDWIAFSGITQFLTTIVTASAVIIALYQIRKQYKTCAGIKIIPTGPERNKRNGYEEMGFKIVVTNLSKQQNIYIDEVSINSGKRSVHFKLSDKIEMLQPNETKIYILENSLLLGYEIQQDHRRFIAASVRTTDGKTIIKKYPYFKQWVVMFSSVEQRNTEIGNYKAYIDNILSDNKELIGRAANAARAAFQGSYYDKTPHKLILKRIISTILVPIYWLTKKKTIYICFLIIVFMTFLFFAINGVVAVFDIH